MLKKIRISDLAEVATCERRVYLRARYGERSNEATEAARERGTQVHDAVYRAATGQDGGDRRCYLASQAWGPEARETVALRAWRDRCLLGHAAGRCFVAAYYRLSPLLVAACRRSAWLDRALRALLAPLARRALRWHTRTQGCANDGARLQPATAGHARTRGRGDFTLAVQRARVGHARTRGRG